MRQPQDHLEAGGTRPIQRPMFVPDLEERTGLSPNTLAHFRQTGRGPRWYKLGRRVVYDRADVEAWLEAQKNAAGA